MSPRFSGVLGLLEGVTVGVVVVVVVVVDDGRLLEESSVQVPVSMMCPPNPPSPIVTCNSAGFWPPNQGVYSGTDGQAKVVWEVVVEPTDSHTVVSLHAVV